jgi:hypothetical protein
VVEMPDRGKVSMLEGTDYDPRGRELHRVVHIFLIYTRFTAYLARLRPYPYQTKEKSRNVSFPKLIQRKAKRTD